MRKFTTKHVVYTFDELSEEAKQTAIESLSDINVDYYWYYDEWLEEVAEEYGIKLKWADLCFDLDRGNYLYIDNHGHGSKEVSYLDDERKFLKKSGIDLRTRDAREILDNGISLDCKHYGGGDGRSIINTDGCDITGDAEDKLQETINELCDRLLKALREDYEWRTSEEAIIETIEANEYEFYEDGRMA